VPEAVTGTRAPAQPRETTRNGSAVEKARSSDDSAAASPSESRKWRMAFEPRGIGVARVRT
jgi:hypothetical protein